MSSGSARSGRARQQRDGESRKGREKKDGCDMWAPHVRSTSPHSLACHTCPLTQVMEIWTSREPISNFKDFNVHFGSSGT